MTTIRTLFGAPILGSALVFSALEAQDEEDLFYLPDMEVELFDTRKLDFGRRGPPVVPRLRPREVEVRLGVVLQLQAPLPPRPRRTAAKRKPGPATTPGRGAGPTPRTPGAAEGVLVMDKLDC